VYDAGGDRTEIGRSPQCGWPLGRRCLVALVTLSELGAVTYHRDSYPLGRDAVGEEFIEVSLNYHGLVRKVNICLSFPTRR